MPGERRATWVVVCRDAAGVIVQTTWQPAGAQAAPFPSYDAAASYARFVRRASPHVDQADVVRGVDLEAPISGSHGRSRGRAPGQQPSTEGVHG
jgi:hypothetical protein